MLEDKYNLLDYMRMNRDTVTVDNIADVLTDNFRRELVTKNDEILINMVFTPNPTQAQLDVFLTKWDIEVAGGAKALMLAYFMKLHPELKFNEYTGPRLKGLLNYFKFQNMKLISHFTKICNELQKENIEVMIFKGGAMKHLRHEFPRVMGDIDVLVHEKDYQKAGHIAEGMGYDAEWDVHSIDLHPKGSQEGIMDIHKFIHMNTGYERSINDDLFERATRTKVFGVNALIPCTEDLFFIVLVNMVRNLRHKTSINGLLYALFDVQFLINSKPDFNWNIVMEDARKTKTEVQVYFATEYINKIVPCLLPEKLQKSALFEKEIKDYCTLLMYQRFFLWDMKLKSHELKFADIFKSKDKFIEYLKLKPKYFVLKLFIFRKNPKLARAILKFYEKHHIGV